MQNEKWELIRHLGIVNILTTMRLGVLALLQLIPTRIIPVRRQRRFQMTISRRERRYLDEFISSQSCSSVRIRRGRGTSNLGRSSGGPKLSCLEEPRMLKNEEDVVAVVGFDRFGCHSECVFVLFGELVASCSLFSMSCVSVL